MAIPPKNNTNPITFSNENALFYSEVAIPWRYPLAKVKVKAESMI